jgi:hypothetical protein
VCIFCVKLEWLGRVLCGLHGNGQDQRSLEGWRRNYAAALRACRGAQLELTRRATKVCVGCEPTRVFALSGARSGDKVDHPY